MSSEPRQPQTESRPDPRVESLEARVAAALRPGHLFEHQGHIDACPTLDGPASLVMAADLLAALAAEGMHVYATPIERVAAPSAEGSKDDTLRTDVSLYRGRVEAFDAVLAYVRQVNGNGHDEPSDPALDAVYDNVTDLRSRATAALAATRSSRAALAATDPTPTRDELEARATGFYDEDPTDPTPKETL